MEKEVQDIIDSMDDKNNTICKCGVVWTTGLHGPSDMFAVSVSCTRIARRFDLFIEQEYPTNIITCSECGSVLAVNDPRKIVHDITEIRR